MNTPVSAARRRVALCLARRIRRARVLLTRFLVPVANRWRDRPPSAFSVWFTRCARAAFPAPPLKGHPRRRLHEGYPVSSVPDMPVAHWRLAFELEWAALDVSQRATERRITVSRLADLARAAAAGLVSVGAVGLVSADSYALAQTVTGSVLVVVFSGVRLVQETELRTPDPASAVASAHARIVHGLEAIGGAGALPAWSLAIADEPFAAYGQLSGELDDDTPTVDELLRLRRWLDTCALTDEQRDAVHLLAAEFEGTLGELRATACALV